MRTPGKALLVLGAFTLLAGLTSAQRPPFLPIPFGGMDPPGGASLLMNKSVQDELKLSKRQAEKVSQFQEKMTARVRDAFPKLAGSKPTEQREKLQALMKEINQEAERFAKDVLRADQARRLKQIEVQLAGVDNFTREEIKQVLQLTDEQKDRLRTIAEDFRRDRQTIRREAGRDSQKIAEARKKVAARGKEAMDEALAVLNDEQKKKWKTLIGEPFDLRLDTFRFPRLGEE